MKRLGYTRYVAQGGDWGAPSPARWRARRRRACWASTSTIRQASRRKSTSHPLAIQHPLGYLLQDAAFEALKNFSAKGAGYRVIMGTRPQTLGYGLADSPVAFAAFIRLQRWRAPALTHQGRGSRQRHAVLANEHRSLFRPNLLGERQQEQYERRCRDRRRSRSPLR